MTTFRPRLLGLLSMLLGEQAASMLRQPLVGGEHDAGVVAGESRAKELPDEAAETTGLLERAPY